MPPYLVMCYGDECKNEARYKIASEWSDGITRELKTYSLCCASCLPKEYGIALEKKTICRQTPGEILGEPEVYERIREGAKVRLVRREELETSKVTR
jgi:hypothetical protein